MSKNKKKTKQKMSNEETKKRLRAKLSAMKNQRKNAKVRDERQEQKYVNESRQDLKIKAENIVAQMSESQREKFMQLVNEKKLVQAAKMINQ